MAQQPASMTAPAAPAPDITSPAPQPVGTNAPKSNPFRTSASGVLEPPYTPAPPSPAPDPTLSMGPLSKYAPAAGSLGTTADPAASTRAQAQKIAPSNNWLSSGLSAITNPGKAFGDAVGSAQKSVEAASATPPLSKFTGNLGSFKGVADSFLGAAKGFLENHPERTAMIGGTLAPSLVEGLGPLSLPAMLGAHGLMAGGESGLMAKHYFDPLLSKLGLS